MKFPFLKKRQSIENPATSLADPAAWLINWINGGDASSAGVSVNEQNSLSVTAVYSCVRIIAETIASLPLQLFERTARGRVISRDHPVYTLLHDAPNPLQTSYYFRETHTAATALWGNGYAPIIFDRSTRRPIELIPIRSDRVTPKLDRGQLSYEIELDDGTKRVLTADEMLHFPALGFDGITGKSPIRLHREAIGLALATEKFGGKFFGSGAKLSGVLTHPATFSSPNVSTRIKDQFVGTYKDSEWGVAMLEEGMKFEPFSMPNDDAQFLETRKLQVAEIARIFRVPVSILGEGDERKANVEQASIDFVTHTIRPWLVRQEQEYNRKLLRSDERSRFFIEHNLDGLLRADSQARGTFYRTLFMIGAISQNEIREKENLNPIENGDRYFVPLNMVASDDPESDVDLDDDDEAEDPAGRASLQALAAPVILHDVFRKKASIVIGREIHRLKRGIRLLENDRVDNYRDFVKTTHEEIREFAVEQFVDALEYVAFYIGQNSIDARDKLGIKDAADRIAREYVAESARHINAMAVPQDAKWFDAFASMFDQWRGGRADVIADALERAFLDMSIAIDTD